MYFSQNNNGMTDWSILMSHSGICLMTKIHRSITELNNAIAGL